MPRSHIEFIFAQTREWTSAADLVDRGQLDWKLLSADHDNGERSGLLRSSGQWGGRVQSDYQEEIYVLDGQLQLDEFCLRRDAYARIEPRHATRWQAYPGTVLLVFLNSATPHEGSGLTVIDAVTMPWDRSGVPKELDYMGIARKPLFVDPTTQNHRTWLLSVTPQCVPRGKQLERETHGCAEEVFMLSGDITGPHGVMTAGAYFWRPKNTLHGPFGSREGGLAICRFRHGPQTTLFHTATLPFDFDARYQPSLPPELGAVHFPTKRHANRY